MSKISVDQARRIENEMNELMAKGQSQLAEWKFSLKGWVNKIKHADGVTNVQADVVYLTQQIDDIKLEILTTEMGELNAVYDIPDTVFDFIMSPPSHLVVPKALSEALQGGHLVDIENQQVGRVL